jgi:multiple sugar transport system permease protein
MTDLQTRPSAADDDGLSPDAAARRARGDVHRAKLLRRQRISSIGKHAGLILLGLLMLYPVLWMVVSSLRPNGFIFDNPGLVLDTFEASNYTNGWNALAQPFGSYLANSAIVVVGSIIGNLLTCSLAAYAFARLRFRFKRFAFAAMLLTMMLPIHVLIIPQYVIFAQLDWINTYLPLIVPKFLATDAFFIFLMVQFIRGIPRELDEAARIDLHVHLDVERLLRTAHLRDGSRQVHLVGRPPVVRRHPVAIRLRSALRDERGHPPPGVPGLPVRSTLPSPGHRHDRRQVVAPARVASGP